ncbi:hypothetical protein KSF78_0003187 [Schistosoma japonicum]|nr:hypothetical protein KSF78_0003187 [Schistosoma japonicum]
MLKLFFYSPFLFINYTYSFVGLLIRLFVSFCFLLKQCGC